MKHKIQLKTVMMFVLLQISVFQLRGQQDMTFVRKGKILVETGFNILNPVGSSNTGANLLLFGGNVSTNLGFEGGYFITQNFAIKGRLNLLSIPYNSPIINLGLGGKYYIGGKVPIELMGEVSIFEEAIQFIGATKLGYGIKLAENINLEPSIGVYFAGPFAFSLGANFSLFL